MNKTSTIGGIGVIDALGIAFVVLKLCGVINWSWWLVTLPFWGVAAIAASICIVAIVVWGVCRIVRIIF